MQRSLDHHGAHLMQLDARLTAIKRKQGKHEVIMQLLEQDFVECWIVLDRHNTARHVTQLHVELKLLQSHGWWVQWWLCQMSKGGHQHSSRSESWLPGTVLSARGLMA